MSTVRIKDLQISERPQEKLINFGVNILTDVELLAIILNKGGKNLSVIDLSRNLLTAHKNLSNLFSLEYQDLIRNKHIKQSKACLIISISELLHRLQKNIVDENEKKKKLKITKPDDVFDFLRPELTRKKKEYLYGVFLNNANSVIGKSLISIGTATETLLEPKEVLSLAVHFNAKKMVLAHNHPSNILDPSLNDIELTNRIFQLSYDLGTHFLDHLIICDTGFTSMRVKGYFSKGGEKY